jgi:hypothetical protein
MSRRSPVPAGAWPFAFVASGATAPSGLYWLRLAWADQTRVARLVLGR